MIVPRNGLREQTRGGGEGPIQIGANAPSPASEWSTCWEAQVTLQKIWSLLPSSVGLWLGQQSLLPDGGFLMWQVLDE